MNILRLEKAKSQKACRRFARNFVCGFPDVLHDFYTHFPAGFSSGSIGFLSRFSQGQSTAFFQKPGTQITVFPRGEFQFVGHSPGISPMFSQGFCSREFGCFIQWLCGTGWELCHFRSHLHPAKGLSDLWTPQIRARRFTSRTPMKGKNHEQQKCEYLAYAPRDRRGKKPPEKLGGRCRHFRFGIYAPPLFRRQAPCAANRRMRRARIAASGRFAQAQFQHAAGHRSRKRNHPAAGNCLAPACGKN